MRKFKLIQPFLVFTFLIISGFSSCDELSQPNEIPDKTTTLLGLSNNPDTLSFKNVSAIKDTTVSVDVFVKVLNKSDLSSNPIVSLYEKGKFQLIQSIELSNWNESDHTFSGSLNLELSTGATTSTDLIATAVTENGNASNFLRKTFVINGLQLSQAIIERPINPDTVFIPTTGSVNFLVGAKVIHPDGQRFLNRVSVNLTDKNNENLGDFLLYNDGSSILLENNLTSGDVSAADSIFSRSFTVNSTNQLDRITLTYKAIDSSNQESNTLTSIMVIFK